MRQSQNKNRMRGRGRKQPNPMSRNYESNGPDVKIRGNAAHIAEKYASLARDALSSGDRVMAENYLQHAEHYNRIIAAANAQMGALRPEDAQAGRSPHSAMDDDGDDDGDLAYTPQPVTVAEQVGEDDGIEADGGDEQPPHPEMNGNRMPRERNGSGNRQGRNSRPRPPRREIAAEGEKAAGISDDAAGLPASLVGSMPRTGREQVASDE